MTVPKLFSLERRRFVQAGVAVAASTCLPGGLRAESVGGQRANAAVTVGVLCPESQRYPTLGAELLAGMQAWAAQDSGGVVLRLLPMNYGSRPGQARDAALQLMDAQPVDVLAAFVCRNAAGQWAPDLAERKVPLLVCDAGANAVQTEALSPWVVHHSLGYWQANWAAGQWAARYLGRRAVVAVGALESGFDMLPAFSQGFESAGGTVQAMHFTHMPDGSNRLPELDRLVRSERPDFVFALDDGHQAEALSALWTKSGLQGRVPLVAAGMLAEALSRRDSFAWTVLPWQADHTRRANARFRAAMGGARPTSMHLLGYEVAQRLSTGIQVSGTNGGRALATTMAALKLETPRGLVGSGADGDMQASAVVTGGPQGAGMVTLGPVDAQVCAGVCSALASRVTNTYLV